MVTIWIVLLGGRVLSFGKEKESPIFLCLCLLQTPLKSNVAICLCGLSSGPVYATVNWRGKRSAVKGKRSKRGGVKHRRRIELFVY